MNDIEEKKKENGLLVAIIVLLVILIGVGGVLIYYDYNEYSGGVENDDEIIEESETDKTQSNLENELVEISTLEAEQLNYDDLYKNIFPAFYDYYGAYIEDIDYGFYYHNSDLRVIEDMPHKIKLSIVSSYVLENYNQYFTGDIAIVPESILKDAYYIIFGNDGYYFEELEDCPGFTKKYDGLKEGEVLFPGCGDTGLPSIKTEIIKYEKNLSNNELYIYEVAGFFTYLGEMGSNKGDLFDLYKDYSKKELVVENLEYLSDDEFDLLAYKDKLNTYKYTFKYKDNGDSETNWRDYYFYSVERVK